MKKFALLILAIAVFGCFAQTSILIYDFKSADLEQSTVSAVHELFKSELTELGYSCFDAPEDAICSDGNCASEGAKKAGAQQALYGTLSRLGDKIIVSIYVADLSGATVHSDRLTSEFVENLDIVVGRLARGIAEGVKAGDVIDKTNVTETESKEPTRRKNFYTVGAKIGYKFPLGDSYGKEQMWHYEAVAMYELEKMFVEGRGYYGSGGDAYAWGLNIGLYYIFSPKDFSPYAGGSAGIEWASIPFEFDEFDDDWIIGFDNGPAVSVSGGLLMFQTYDFRLILDLRYQAVFMGNVEEEHWNWETETYETFDKDLGIQHSLAITLGITRRTTTGDRTGTACCMPW